MTWDKHSASSKAIVLVIVGLALLIPLAMLRSLIAERTALRASAFEQVAQGWGGAVRLGSPLLVIPVTLADAHGAPITRDWYVLPESFDVNADVTVQDEQRSVGIYAVPVFVTKLHGVAAFAAGRQIARLLETTPDAQLHMEGARLVMFMNDPRGLRELMVTENDLVSGALEPKTGSAIPLLTAPVRAELDLRATRPVFAFTLEVAGTRSIRFLPLAHVTRASIGGNWPHPGFTHGFLPIERKVAQRRFDARWQILDVNSAYGGSWFEGETDLKALDDADFGVELVQPVDVYQRAERAVKYGGLFIGVSLLALFLWEHLAARRLHPIQYGLMGLALSLFYLLLLALSEQVGFRSAYLLASAALCSLLGVYLAGAFGSAKAGLGAGSVFAGVYALLYLLVRSEDYSLLAGSLALFALLAAAMILSRKLDWYRAAAADRITG